MLSSFTARNSKKKLFILLLLFSQAGFLFAAQTARAYRKSGTATNTNTVVTVPFNPLNLVVCNDEAVGGTTLYFDFTDGVAATTDDSTNWIALAGECVPVPLYDKDVLNTFTVGLITSSSTAAYRVMASR